MPTPMLPLLLLAIPTQPNDTAIFRYDVAERSVALELLNPVAVGERIAEIAMHPDGDRLSFYLPGDGTDPKVYLWGLGEAGREAGPQLVTDGKEMSFAPAGDVLLLANPNPNQSPAKAGITAWSLDRGEGVRLMDGGRPLALPDGWVCATFTALGRRPALFNPVTGRTADINGLWPDRRHYGWASRSRGRLLVVSEPAPPPDPIDDAHRAARRLELVAVADDGTLTAEVALPCPDGVNFLWISTGCDAADDLFFVVVRLDGPIHEVWHVDADRTARPILRGWEGVEFRSLAASPDGSQLYFTSNLLDILPDDGTVRTEADLVVTER